MSDTAESLRAELAERDRREALCEAARLATLDRLEAIKDEQAAEIARLRTEVHDILVAEVTASARAEDLQGEVERLKTLCLALADRLALASEVLGRAAERKKVCCACLKAMTWEDLPQPPSPG